MRLPTACGVPAVVSPDVTTDLETDIGAGNVEEALAVEGADLHVFDRLGLDGKIGSLRPRNCDKSCRGAEEKTFHHLHSNLQVALSMGGFRLRRVHFRPKDGRSPSVPSSVQSRIKTPSRPGTQTWRLGMPPPSQLHITRRHSIGND